MMSDVKLNILKEIYNISYKFLKQVCEQRIFFWMIHEYFTRLINILTHKIAQELHLENEHERSLVKTQIIVCQNLLSISQYDLSISLTFTISMCFFNSCGSISSFSLSVRVEFCCDRLAEIKHMYLQTTINQQIHVDRSTQNEWGGISLFYKLSQTNYISPCKFKQVEEEYLCILTLQEPPSAPHATNSFLTTKLRPNSLSKKCYNE